MEAHVEDDYIDFYYERNLPELLSKEGPAMSVADINGDGLADVFLGGGKAMPRSCTSRPLTVNSTGRNSRSLNYTLTLKK